MDTNAMAAKIIEILDGKKARDIRNIDIKEISVLADCFIICSGTSTTHIKTLADEIEEKMGELGINYSHKEGYNSARWILMDYGNVVVHIFHEEDRDFYNLERLWVDGNVTYHTTAQDGNFS